MHKQKVPSKINLLDCENIISKLVCPKCSGKLNYLDSSLKCKTKTCGYVYPIILNVPILIDEDKSLFCIEDYKSVQLNLKKDKYTKIKKSLKRIIPTLSNNLSSKKNFKLLSKLLTEKTKPKILIVGGGEITTNTEMLFNNENLIIETDVYIGERTSLVIDAHNIPFSDKTFDLVVFQAVLEHVINPEKCVSEAFRVLKEDGYIFATTPFMQAVHLKQYDFTRFTFLGHRRLFRSFKEIESGNFAGTGVALGWSIRYFVRSFTNIKLLRYILEISVIFLFFWLKYIDYLTIKNKGTYDGASGFYFIGQKNDFKLDDKELIKLFRGIK